MMTMRGLGFNPFTMSAARAVDELLDSVFDQVASNGSGASGREQRVQTVTAPVNIWEDENSLFIECELPGFAIDDVEITVLKNRLMLSGTRKFELPENATVLRRERVGERFSRAIDLPMSVDFDQAQAHLEHGVLRITLPKAQEARPRRIEVRST